MKLLNKVFISITFLTFVLQTKCDYYTSVVGLENLLDVENYFVNSVKEYLNNLEKVNKEIESFLDEVERDHEEIFKNPNKYYENPINSFKLIKRLVLDWKHIDDLNKRTIEFEEVYNKNVTLSVDKYTPPTGDDLLGAAKGLTRLQKMYKLDTEDLVEGYIKDYKYSEELSAHDCFVMARSLYEAKEYLYASDWFMEALQLLDNMNEQDEECDECDGDDDGDDKNKTETNEYPYVTRVQILKYLGPALFHAGNRKLASLMNNQLLEMDPENKFGLTNMILFDNQLIAERRVRIINNSQTQKSEKQDLYAKVCSGELQQTSAEKRPLRCRYITNNVPFYFVGPFKMEELNHEPFVAYYHKAIYENEIEQIIENVENIVQRSKVGSVFNSNYNEMRISKNSWLWFHQHEFLSKIHQRLEDITGLSMVTGEALQVANYGIGGHYGPHHDFSEYPDQDYPGRGNRILTALFYINEVEMGGATAFPYLRLAVPAIKYSLVVWHNLHKSLEPDYRTKHAGCPVLKGSKWICNEWFHAIGQEFKRPCDLKPDGEISLPFKDKL